MVQFRSTELIDVTLVSVEWEDTVCILGSIKISTLALLLGDGVA